jgi:alkaline phosphatase D
VDHAHRRQAERTGRRGAGISRRQFLAASGAVGAAAVGLATPPWAQASAATVEGLPSDPFTLGVASGDALPGAVVIWTRLTTAPTEPGLGMTGVGPVAVDWEVAATPRELGASPLAAGTVLADPADAWSVHVDVTGLRPDGTYYYRFRAGGWTSPVGVTRTTPVPSASRPARFAVISCENLAKPGGGQFYFNGVSHIAGRDDLDFVVLLGDYIYEFGRPAHIPSRPCVSLEDYRRRYGEYKSRESLRAMHSRLPVYAVPDDHELWDNVLGGDPGMSPDDRQRLGNALQAFWENMPLRGGPPRWDEATGRMHLPLHRRVTWGSNLELLLVDDRQYRTEGTTILGAEQMDWLLDAVAGSHATWTAIGSGVPVSWFPRFPGAGDKWTGYDADRSALTDALSSRLAARARRPFNPVVLSGDIHRGVVTHVRRRQDEGSALVATEFVGPPMTSNSGRDFAEYADAGAFRAQYAYESGGALQSFRGYLDCAVTSSDWTSSFVLGDEVDRPDGTVRVMDSWRLPAGAPVGAVERL